MERRCKYLHKQLCSVGKLSIPSLNASGSRHARQPSLPPLAVNYNAEAAIDGVDLLGIANEPGYVDELDVQLAEVETRLKTADEAVSTLQAQVDELHEAREVIREMDVFFAQSTDPTSVTSSPSRSRSIRLPHSRRSGSQFTLDEEEDSLLDHTPLRTVSARQTEEDEPIGSDFITGTIDRQQMPVFERILWRVLRGNLYMNYTEIHQSFQNLTVSEKYTPKNVFIIFAHGAQILSKIKKVCQGMGATVHQVDRSVLQRAAALRQIDARLGELDTILYNTSASRRQQLIVVARNIHPWMSTIAKEKAVYNTLNLLNYDAARGGLLAKAWLPLSEWTNVQNALRRGAQSSGSILPAILKVQHTQAPPPTYHRTNKVTEGFQALIDAYGIATYQEINPALFATATFPFMFAVMFGDIGHAFITTVSAAAMIFYEKPLSKAGWGELFDIFFYGRYIILLMGIVSLFTGLIYNDIFSQTLHIWQSGWKFSETSSNVIEAIRLNQTYPIGIDPAWHGADNALVFTNSLKMKMSIIIGVIHMTFAICLNIPNFLHFNTPQYIWAEFVPQIIFFHSIFGYLVICIIMKWLTDWRDEPISPPGLLNMLIQMFLSPGNVPKHEQLYRGQAFVQVCLLMLALVCVPWILCAKPYLVWKEKQAIKKLGYRGIGEDGVDHLLEQEDETEANTTDHGLGGGPTSGQVDEEHEGFTEIIVHQVIHTIEFCLGCISNTASYLRLWALSLAHAQLSEVLWSMTIEPASKFTGWSGMILKLLIYSLWLSLSIQILCLMEGLSAFLHALRLHWVEANSKHYNAGGHPFLPLTFPELDLEQET